MNRKVFLKIALVFIVVVLVGAVEYFILNNRSPEVTLEPNIGEELPLAPPGAEPSDDDVVEIEPIDTNDPPVVIRELPNWQFIDANSFTLSLPLGWTFNKLQGMDSYVGEFVGDGVKLSFDYGWYSSSLAEDGDPNYTVSYETISGYNAKIVVPKIGKGGLTGVYFDDLGGDVQKNKLAMYGYELSASQQENALKIFRTLQFKQ